MSQRPVVLLAMMLSAASPASAQIIVNVDAAANRHAIDPRIYGASFAPPATISELDLTLNRWGGNAMSRYNWIYSTANRCKDWYFQNIQDSVAGDGANGESADSFIAATRNAGAQPMMTIPMMSLLPKDAARRCSYSILRYPAYPQEKMAPDIPECGNGRAAAAPHDRLLNINDPADTSAPYTVGHQANWIQHMIATWGTAAARGVRYYGLDNEPGLWSFDHWDVHPTGSTYDEVWGKWQEYGSMIRAQDPNAVITGPEEWGWDGYFVSGLDNENRNTADRDAHGGVPYIDWLMQQAHAYDVANQSRILDVVTVHFYPQGKESVSPVETEFSANVTPGMQALRNRSTRSLWDAAYVNESWIGGTAPDGGIVKLIPRLKAWAAIYPGTKIGLTEYNWGADQHINGGTAQADVLGILGREGVDLGVRWESPPAASFTYNAFKMYRNYDGAHAKFGDVSVTAGGPDPDEVAAFAAFRTSDGALTIMLVSKTAGPKPATINFANFVPALGASAEERHLVDDGAGVPTISNPVTIPLAGMSVPITLPGQSVTIVVIPGARGLNAPANLAGTATNASQVALSWTVVAGATRYDIYGSSANNTFAYVKSTAGTAENDFGVARDTTYLYKVSAYGAMGSSPLSAVDAATTTMFTDDPLATGTIIKAAHVIEMRIAVSSMRAAAGLGAQPFSDPALAAGTSMRAAHINQLRSALNEARTIITLPPLAYTDNPIVAGTTTAKKDHVVEIRNGVK